MAVGSSRRRRRKQNSLKTLQTTSAAKAFEKNLGDFARLCAVHGEIGGSEPGRRYNLEVLNKAAILFLFAAWESYCEDVVAETLRRTLRRCARPTRVPLYFQKYIAKKLNDTKDELAVWHIAGPRWKKVLLEFLRSLEVDRNGAFNTPRADKIDKMFDECLGIAGISSFWHWQGMTVQASCEKLKRFVRVRGDIAHRLHASKPVRLRTVREYEAHIRRLVNLTDKEIVDRINGGGARMRATSLISKTVTSSDSPA